MRATTTVSFTTAEMAVPTEENHEEGPIQKQRFELVPRVRFIGMHEVRVAGADVAGLGEVRNASDDWPVVPVAGLRRGQLDIVVGAQVKQLTHVWTLAHVRRVAAE